MTARAARGAAAALVALALLHGCAARGPAWRTVRAHGGRPLVVAHRGGSVDAPENTLAAFRTAISRGVAAAECDVHLSADGAVVVIHDAELERTTNGTGRVRARTLAELRALDAGGWMAPAFAGQRIPELGELLALVAGRLVLFVELKDGDGLEERVAALLAPRARRGSVVLLSFDAGRITRAKSRLPDVPTMLLARRQAGEPPRALVQRALAAKAAAVGVEHARLDRALVDAAHDAELGVFAWTVNDADVARRLAAVGVDGIITDRPDRIGAALGDQP